MVTSLSAIMMMLLEQKADLEVTNTTGRGSLSFAVVPSMGGWPSQPEAVRMLLSLGADQDKQDNKEIAS